MGTRLKQLLMDYVLNNKSVDKDELVYLCMADSGLENNNRLLDIISKIMYMDADNLDEIWSPYDMDFEIMPDIVYNLSCEVIERGDKTDLYIKGNGSNPEYKFMLQVEGASKSFAKYCSEQNEYKELECIIRYIYKEIKVDDVKINYLKS